MTKGLNLKIADIVFSILPAKDINRFSLDKEYIPFMTDEEPKIVLKTIRKTPSGIKHKKYIFSAAIWDYCQVDGRHIFNFSYSSKNERPQRRLVLYSDFKTGEILSGNENGALQNPFSYPLDQVLTITLLTKKQGILVHSCGFAYKNKGYLFIGSSGTGKSTMANIIMKNKDGTILSDDRIVVRKRHGHFYIYGTPWHGTAGFVSPEKTPLKGLFFLKKGANNYLQKLSLSDTVSRLFKCSFPPFWNKKGISSALKLCEDIAISIPSFEFIFTPDDRAFDSIRKEVD